MSLIRHKISNPKIVNLIFFVILKKYWPAANVWNHRLKAASDWPTLAEYYIVQPRPVAELGPSQASEAKVSSSGPLVATAELKLLLIH